MIIAVNALFTWVQFRTRADRWRDEPAQHGQTVAVASPWAPR